MKTKTSALRFPIITGKPLPPSLRSIDEINEWIEQDYRLFFDRKVYEEAKRRNSVNVRFALKD
jgi:hypothetical protein